MFKSSKRLKYSAASKSKEIIKKKLGESFKYTQRKHGKKEEKR